MSRDLSNMSGWLGGGGNGYPQGWLDIPERRVMAAALPTYQQGWKLFAEPTTPILLYRAWHDVLGKYPDYVAQEIGDCVSHGHGHANDNLQCVEIALGEPSTYSETSTEYIYGASRKLAGLLGNQDGCFGSAAVAAMLKGFVPRSAPYSGKTAKSYGYYGPPAELEQAAQQYKLGAVAKIEDWAGLVSAHWNGFTVSICSNQGFTLERDQDGFCAPQGTWNHCMFTNAVRFDRPGALINQSWGPTTPSGPTSLDQPSFSFWADRRVIERILAQGDSWALMRAPEFTRRSLPGSWTRAA